MPRMSARVSDQWQSRLLALVAVTLVVLGIAAVYGASSIQAVEDGHAGWYYAFKQLTFAAFGGALLVIVARSDYRFWRKEVPVWFLLAGCVAGLILVVLPFTHFIAPEINGARRWLRLGSLSVQPSEFATLSAVIWTAMMATRKERTLRSLRRGVLPLLVILVPVATLILLEPDLSTAARLLLVCGVVAFIGGARIGHFLLTAVLALPVLLAAVLAEPYRVGRILTFTKTLLAILGFGEEAAAEASWQITQSLVGIGSGQLFGVGFGEGMQKLGYLPHAFSDFIFSTIGEEWGFLGAVVILVFYSLYVGIGFHIAHTAADRFGMLLATGVTVMIGLTALLHIAVTLALAPTTGLPLPFVSYGGSDLLVSLIGTGLLVSIANRRGPT